mgnify:CR=1 FL=1
MRLPRDISALALLAILALSGCSYVHFGRLPVSEATVVGDEQVLKENADLRTEKKMLQQELALSHAQGEALRSAIENRASDGDTSKRLTEKLNETTRELATLRANYAKLQAERAQSPGANPADIAALQSKLGTTEEKLADSLHNYTQLQEEIGRLRTEVDHTRTENLALTEKVKVVTAQNAEAQAALAQLNTQLLAQKEERTRVEQDAATLRTQLQSANSRLSALAQQRTGAAGDARALAATTDPKAADAGSVEVRTQLEALRKQVWTLESERTELEQKLAAAEAIAKNPAYANAQAQAETKAKLTEALENAKMLRDENDHLKTSVADFVKTKADLEAALAKARSDALDPGQAQSLRDQLRQAQAQVSTLADENSLLKARVAAAGGASGSGAATSVAPAGVQPGSAVTATFVTSSGSPVNSGLSVRSSGGPLRFHTVASGDTLSKISNLYYGTPSRWADILVANRDVLGENNNLVIGRTLRIP